MLHVRIQTPSERTEEVLGLIQKTVGTTHVGLLPGASLDPEGDIVMCDIAREAADVLLHQLRERGLCDEGAVMVDHVDLSLSKRADQAEKDAPGEGADAVVWESLVEETHEESTLSVTFVAMLTLATLLAACGVMIDSAILIVGAMAVGPEFGPVAGMCVALVQRRPRLVGRSLLALLVGFAAAMVLAIGFSQLMDAFGYFTETRLDGKRPQTEFIWHADAFSFIVALLAGAAGTLSLTSSKSGALVGVAISVTTVPAAANAAIALSYGDFSQAQGSTEQLLLNLLGIVVAGTLTLLIQKAYWSFQHETVVQHLRKAAVHRKSHGHL
ncbi:DUF389 domain-containing protein [Streptomyces sp. A7024]|uniref:DUF389 domain-containing protein n=1 Tax=Streptomyces coryli TaxID=1128680 RepID=A0A6G4TUU9_9ACTN|nr:DUF389 domain-containing protein [Streptomyces coryli]NGN63789.1 DUF389 domain-containing protein [Streptomyces coryli]